MNSCFYQLRCIGGDYRPTLIKLKLNTALKKVTLGRSQKATHQVKSFNKKMHSKMSRTHVEITIDDDKLVLQSLSRHSNSTLLNNKPIFSGKKFELQIGDKITMVQATYILEKGKVVVEENDILEQNSKRKRNDTDRIYDTTVLPRNKERKKLLIRVDDLIGCAGCEDLIIDPIVLPCSHSLCFVCCHKISLSTKNECPTCCATISTHSWCRSIKLDQLVTRFIEHLSNEEIIKKYSRRIAAHQAYTKIHCQESELEVLLSVKVNDSDNNEPIVLEESCLRCGKTCHKEHECQYIDDDTCNGCSLNELEEGEMEEDEEDEDDDGGW